MHLYIHNVCVRVLTHIKNMYIRNEFEGLRHAKDSACTHIRPCAVGMRHHSVRCVSVTHLPRCLMESCVMAASSPRDVACCHRLSASDSWLGVVFVTDISRSGCAGNQMWPSSWLDPLCLLPASQQQAQVGFTH